MKNPVHPGPISCNTLGCMGISWGKWFSIGAVALTLASCASTPPQRPVDPTPPNEATYRFAAKRLSAVVVADSKDIATWIRERFNRKAAPDNADGGSATPISADGYFLTACHVVAEAGGRQIFIVHGNRGSLESAPARVVWEDETSDLALLHSALHTPNYYEWTPGNQWLPIGTPIMHAGIATGFESEPGKLTSAIPPSRSFHRFSRFKHDIPLRPGDSGGPVLDAKGRLIGINSAVEFLVPMETAFFIESEGNRPDPTYIQKLIERDRSSSSR